MASCTACGDAHPPETTTCPRTRAPVTGGPCGTTIDRYQVERWIGGGGAGAVYRARHRMIGQPVALKLLRRGLERDVEAVARFKREAQAAAAIGHPRIPRMLDLGVTEDGRPFLVMDLLEGRDLRALLDAEAPLAPTRAVDLAVQILEGLAAAHRAGIVHRDIKPANIFVARGVDGGEQVRILDFGLSRMAEPMRTMGLTAAGAVIGTPFYMSPEQAAGAPEVDARADIYSTAVVLYQALSRALPFPGDSVESVLVRIASETPVPLAHVAPATPPALAAVISQALSRDPAARPATADDFARQLRDAKSAPAQAPSAWPAPAQGEASMPGTRAMTAAPMPAFQSGDPAARPAPAPVAAAPTPMSQAAPPPRVVPAPAKSTSRTLWIVLALVAAPFLFLVVAGAFAAVVGWMRAREAMTPVGGTSTAPSALTSGTGVPQLPPPRATVGGPENPPDVVRATLAQSPVPAAPAPSGPKRGVSIGMPVLEGPVSEDALGTLLGRARATLDPCRPNGPPQRVRLRFTVAPDGRLTRAPFAGNDADAIVSACVASKVEAQSLPSSPTAGSFRVEVALAPR